MTGVVGMMSIVTLRIEGRTEGITMTVIGQEMRSPIEIEILEGIMTEICLSVMNLMHLNVGNLQSMLQQFQEIKELHQKFCHHDQSI